MCEDKKSCITINCGCCSNSNGNSNNNGNGNGNDSTPVGTVISYMGTSAPEHYFICDGTIYNIADYKYFSQFIRDQFGSYNFFGGDGTTTFAIPDLRNEFLRGYHGDKTEKLSGDIGIHQKATNHLGLMAYGGSTRLLQSRSVDSNTTETQTEVDSYRLGVNWRNYGQSAIGNDTGGVGTYTSRPTNTAVLYCIKYE